MTQEVIQRMNEIVINIEDNKNEFLNAIIAERNKI